MTSMSGYILMRLMDLGSVSSTLSAAFDIVSLNVAVRFSFACRSYQAMSRRIGKLVILQRRLSQYSALTTVLCAART